MPLLIILRTLVIIKIIRQQLSKFKLVLKSQTHSDFYERLSVVQQEHLWQMHKHCAHNERQPSKVSDEFAVENI